MPMKQFKIETMREMDHGRPAAMFEADIKRAVADAVDRPTDGKARVVTLKVVIKPVVNPSDPSGSCDEIAMALKSSVKLPDRQTRTYSLSARAGGIAAINIGSEDQVRQGVLLDGESPDFEQKE